MMGLNKFHCFVREFDRVEREINMRCRRELDIYSGTTVYQICDFEQGIKPLCTWVTNP